jgi:hypothetical protein
VSAIVLAGMLTVMVGVMVNVPRPEFCLAWKNTLPVVGAVVPAGTSTGYVMPLLSGFVQVPLPLLLAQATVGAVRMLEAEVDNVLLVLLVPENVVDVIDRLQPAPVPLGSTTVSPNEYVVVWSLPVKATGAAETVVGPDSDKLVPVTATLAFVPESAKAAMADPPIANARITKKPR